jgi:hypothetical protein
MTAAIVGHKWRNPMTPTRISWFAFYAGDADRSKTLYYYAPGQLWSRLAEVAR